VGLMRLSQDMLATARGLGLRTACGKAPRKDLYTRERDSVDVMRASNCGEARGYAKANEDAVKDSTLKGETTAKERREAQK
jgi:hypothetical protein